MLGPRYFYVIIGGGLAGLQLARQLSRDVFFKGKKIAIIDSDFSMPVKTWCFWEKGKGKWDDLLTKSWNKGKFISSEENIDLQLSPYTYKMIKAKDYHQKLQDEIEESGDIEFITDEIQKIDPVTMKAKGQKKSYGATHFFDSRVDPSYLESKKHTTIFQHFKGWEVETEKPVFTPDSFTMMDYRIKYPDATAFTYILPFTEKKALVEYTFFSPFLTEDKVYDEMLQQYFEKVLKTKDFKIKSTETGVIPMTDFPFDKANTEQITKIGTGGGWVKPSTGYSFKNTEKRIAKIIDNIKSGKQPGENLINNKFRKYDAIFLDVLAQNNQKGEEIFTKFYTKNSPQDIFRYLDEETSVSEDLKIMLSLYSFDFVASFFRKTF
ncbi:lycopene cyclase family protein [Salegentibacter mishustinae]|uniref:Lycopene cyclase n=1 Tax=Salegentibacter mishustinae TaxID=270918 RepID=A0A0Q9Z9L4_9FLAO|nr:lycopene cyclase family protein [Salegentibacter mishustinae]KRG29677.1 lycopene cyclase [Salegentibacter mishustinae]PNW22088.1 lycopene cyclase [Salegentibacter mishustinae]PZX67299.1 lycopene beta-cyclase [Salegentibacter mishustinae]GGW80662.1 lycopene cyclase [Salegentibacter mishustinae]